MEGIVIKTICLALGHAATMLVRSEAEAESEWCLARGGSEAHLPGEARVVELVHTVSGQVREMEASRSEDQGGQINHASARQGREALSALGSS